MDAGTRGATTATRIQQGHRRNGPQPGAGAPPVVALTLPGPRPNGAGHSLCSCLIEAVDACGEPAFVVDRSLELIRWNAAAEAAFDLPASAALGRTCFDVLRGRSAAGRPVCHNTCAKWALARRGARVRSFEICALPPRGIWLDITVLPLVGPGGEMVALAHIARNIDHLKKLEGYVRSVATSSADVLAGRPSVGMVPEPTPAGLTAREAETLRLLARGVDTGGLAEALGISHHTARNHVAAVLSKLGVHSRIEAAAYAFKHDLA